MKTIYKYPLRLTDVQTMRAPEGARFLSAQSQHGEITVWALVAPDAPIESYTVRIVGTGNPIQPNDLTGLRYLNTAQQDGFVWHVFVPSEAA